MMEAAVWLLSEFIIKLMVSQPRPGSTGLMTNTDGVPVGSCSPSCGYPSSHSVVAYSILTKLILDAAYRLDPTVPEAECPLPVDLKSMRDLLRCVKVFPHGKKTPRQFVVFSYLWILLLGPVPISRVILYDHSPEQVSAGCLIGVAFATVWFYTTRHMFGQHEKDAEP